MQPTRVTQLRPGSGEKRRCPCPSLVTKCSQQTHLWGGGAVGQPAQIKDAPARGGNPSRRLPAPICSPQIPAVGKTPWRTGTRRRKLRRGGALGRPTNRLRDGGVAPGRGEMFTVPCTEPCTIQSALCGGSGPVLAAAAALQHRRMPRQPPSQVAAPRRLGRGGWAPWLALAGSPPSAPRHGCGSLGRRRQGLTRTPRSGIAGISPLVTAVHPTAAAAAAASASTTTTRHGHGALAGHAAVSRGPGPA